MKVFTHFAVEGFSNSYLIGEEESGEAILIDPGIMDVHLLELIEKNNFYVKYVLATHSHENHIRGLKTLKKIYNADLYCHHTHLLDYKSNLVKDGDVLELAGITIEAIQVLGHTSDSLVFRIGNMLFTGDILYAGKIGSTANAYAHGNLVQGIKERLLCFEHDFVFPGHGPPSTIKAESLYNDHIKRELCGCFIQQPYTRHVISAGPRRNNPVVSR